MNRVDLSDYDKLAKGEMQDVSVYIAAIKNYIEYPSVKLITERLEAHFPSDTPIRVTQDEDTFFIELGEEEQAFRCQVVIENNLKPEEWAYEAADYCIYNLQEDEREAMQHAPQIVEIMGFLRLDCALADVMLQFGVLHAIAGKCYAVRDPMSSLFYSGAWLAEMAISQTPPTPEAFYVIHAVHSDDGSAELWCHTHGLLKFGVPEVEILHLPVAGLRAGELILNSLVQRFFYEPDLWQSEESVLVARSPEQLFNVRFLAWQTALQSDLVVKKKGLFRKKTPFLGDEQDRDEAHSAPSMAIFADVNGQLQPLSAYGKALEEQDNLMGLLPYIETERMAQLANEKLPLFRRCLTRHPASKDWVYWVKVACRSAQTEALEHMWFDVKTQNATHFTAELMNSPYDIPEMQAGETYDVALEDITDWQIRSQRFNTTITPDNVFQLRRYLNAN